MTDHNRHDDTAPRRWRRSTRCANGACLEVAIDDDGTVHVRDAKNPRSPILRFSPASWTALLAALRAGEMH